MKHLVARDPVALKELRGVSRRWQTYLGRCLYVGMTAALLYQYWKQHWIGAVSETPIVSVSEFAALGRAIFVRCEWVSLGLTVLMAAIAGSEMLAREIRAGTLGLLLVTPLSPRGVVLGKWKGAALIAVALYACSTPVLAISVYLGGPGPEDLVRSAILTLGLASVAGAVGLYYSARLGSTGAAVAAAIPAMIGCFAATWIADVLGTILLEMARGGVTAGAHAGGVATAAASALGTLVALNAAVRQVKIRTGTIPGTQEHARELRTLALDGLREHRRSKPLRALLRWRAVWEGNPLLWKEFTLRPALRIREDWRARSYVILYFLFLASWVVTACFHGAGFFPVWGAFFVTGAIAGGSMLFAPEKEGRQWLVLMSTPVTPAEIVRAKLLCGLIFPEALGILVLYALALAAWVGDRPMQGAAAVCLAASLFLLFCYALSAAASLRVRTARTAFLFTAGIAAALVTLPELLSGSLRPLAGGPLSAWRVAWDWIEALDPVLVFDRFVSRDWIRMHAPGEAVDGLLRFVVLYLPVTLLLPVEMVVRFRKIALHA